MIEYWIMKVRIADGAWNSAWMPSHALYTIGDVIAQAAMWSDHETKLFKVKTTMVEVNLDEVLK